MHLGFQERKWIRPFFCIAGCIILAAALVRLFGVIKPRQLLALSDPVIGISLRYAASIIGCLELTVALACLFGKNIKFQALLILWLTTNFITYRSALIWMEYQPRCSGWGTLTNPLQLPLAATDRAFLFAMTSMFVGSCVITFSIWKQPSRSLTAAVSDANLKISCERCGGHIAFSAECIDHSIFCPHCQESITLRRPRPVKSLCISCHGHLEFPSHAIGQVITCPHCAISTVLQEPKTH